MASADKPRKSAASKRRKPERVAVARGPDIEPRLPHELDESSDSQERSATQPDAIGRKAFDDVMAGRVDTDRGPVLEELFRKHYQRPDPPARKRRRQR